VVVEAGELSPYSQFLISRNAHFDFAVDYVRRHKVTSQSWHPDEAVLQEFKDWLVSEKISTPKEIEEGFAEKGTTDDVLMRIRSEVFNAIWGQDASHRVRAEKDVQIQRALQLFNRAGKLLAERDALKSTEGERMAGKTARHPAPQQGTGAGGG